eukprot:UN02089
MQIIRMAEHSIGHHVLAKLIENASHDDFEKLCNRIQCTYPNFPFIPNRFGGNLAHSMAIRSHYMCIVFANSINKNPMQYFDSNGIPEVEMENLVNFLEFEDEWKPKYFERPPSVSLGPFSTMVHLYLKSGMLEILMPNFV